MSTTGSGRFDRAGFLAALFVLLTALLVFGFAQLADAKGPPPDRPPVSPPVGPPLSPPIGPPLSPPMGPPLSPPVGPPVSPPVGPPAQLRGEGVGWFVGGEGAAQRVGGAFVVLMGLATAGFARSVSADLTPRDDRKGRHLKRRR